MKTLSKTLLATAAFAFATTPASATESVQVVDEDTGQVCGAFGSGAECHMHLVGTVTLRVDLVFFETNEATCNLEVERRINGQGDARIDQVEHDTGPDANCAAVTTECNLPWAASGEEDGPTGVVQSNVNVCLDPAESDSGCVGNIAYNLVEQAEEHLETQFSDTAGLCELDVSLEIEHEFEPHEEIHINHP